MKHWQEFNIAQKLTLNLIEWVEKRVYKRKWCYREQVWFARSNTIDDAQWMSHNKIAKEVSVRHNKMLVDEWWTTSHKSQDGFRDEIGLNPHWKK